jgi:hypothetical protein
LKRRIFDRWSITDLAIPIIFLSVSQFEAFTISINEAHSLLPLLLVMLYGVAWTLRSRALRLSLVLIINFLAIFTGFGLFLGVITPALLFVDLLSLIRSKEKTLAYYSVGAIALALISGALFFLDYHFNPAASCFQVRPDYFLKYPIYMAVIFGRFLGIDYIQSRWLCIGAGGVLLIITVLIFLISARRMVSHPLNNNTSIIISAFTGFSLLFLLDTAVGRLCLTMNSAYSSRYATLAIPALFAVYVYLQSMPKNPPARLFLAGFLLIMAISIPLKSSDLDILTYFAEKKQEWKACYLELENVDTCNTKASFNIYPTTSPELLWRLGYLKTNHLNLYYSSSFDPP